MEKMKIIHAIAILILALTGCGTTTTTSAPPGLWYAEREVPDQFHYSVYVLFQDDAHFQWWRTREDMETVLKRIDYYKHEHPGWDHPTAYSRQGNELTGERKFVTPASASMLANTFIQKFSGRFDGDTLELTIKSYTIMSVEMGADDMMPPPTTVIKWPLKRLGPPLEK
ncbi:hypothetical protein ALP83_03274 [Pseudomonas syringae pv. actinidiae]|uniref:Lipoprotein n=2 Tax=Pseudomonas syringae group TaxID=136849 RepID=A0A7Z6U8A4_PSESF|nr:hypothetical protein ALQ15_01529 [Pseudomonas syringae pv. actinidiae]RMR56996.1 hypothetical protein ALP83_03274 [Pseudomonas syringae pv. actinidiae]